MGKIEKIHDSFFKKVFSEVANVKTFLDIALPADLREQLELSAISLDTTSYVSGKYKEYHSDLVVKCQTRAEAYPVDVYFLLEHKSQPEQAIHLQLLRYKIEGEEIMPTLAERLRNEGKREGSLFEKQNVLMMLLSTRFQLQESEKDLIKSIKDPKKLDRAIKKIVTAAEKKSFWPFCKSQIDHYQ